MNARFSSYCIFFDIWRIDSEGVSCFGGVFVCQTILLIISKRFIISVRLNLFVYKLIMDMHIVIYRE